MNHTQIKENILLSHLKFSINAHFILLTLRGLKSGIFLQ